VDVKLIGANDSIGTCIPTLGVIIAKDIQEAPQCDETRFSTIQPSTDVTGIRNEKRQ